MKRITISLLATFALFGLFYLIGCFTEKSFNISYWRDSARACIGLFGGVIAISFGTFTFVILSLDN